MIAQAAVSSNGGAAVDTTSSSSHLAVAEECTNPPSNSSCGRGEYGYGGGELPFSAVALSSNDTAANGESFACPSTSTGSGTGAVVSATKTGTGGGTTPPQTLLFPGNLEGGNQGLGSNFTGDTECYSPYVQGSSQATGAAAQGNAYTARPTNDSTIGVTSRINGGLNATWFVPNTSGSGTGCAGQVLQAGGDEGNDSTANALLYNPNANSSGFNTWGVLSPTSPFRSTMVAARDTPAEVQLDSVPNAPSGDTQLLLIGGEALVVAGQYTLLNSYEIFDANKCGFLSNPTPSPMSSVRYDFGAAKFASGDVLVCGGAKDSSFDFSNNCDLFIPDASVAGGGTWHTGVATMSRPRAGNFASLIPASITSTGSSILVAGGSSDGGSNGKFAPDPTSDICTETNSTHAVSCSLDKTSGGTTVQFDSSSTDLGFTPQTSIGAEDASHVTIGCNPAEGINSGNTTTQCNSIVKLAGETSDANYDGLILACGGFSGGANSSGGNDTQIDCEYYVPSGRSVPTGLSCNPAGATSGPAWCVKTGLLMNRERAYFHLGEIVAGQSGTNPSVSDSFWASGGFYGEPDATTLAYLVRKNVEFRNKGS